MEVIGILSQTGVYNERPYENVVFHCVRQIVEDGKGVGQFTKAVKVKMSVIRECFGPEMQLPDIFKLLGHKLMFSYNEYKKVDYIRMESETGKDKK